MKLDPEPRLSKDAGLFASLIDWARKVVQAVNERVTLEYLSTGFVYLPGSNGYLKLPNWLGSVVIQWGTFTTTATGVTVPWPVTFPNGFWGMTITPQANTAVFCTYQTPSTSGAYVNAWDTSGAQVILFGTYIAWGN